MQKKAQMNIEAVSSVITLIIGIGIAVFVLIFAGSLGGQTYELVEDDITLTGTVIDQQIAISNSSTTSLGQYFVRIISIENISDSTIPLSTSEFSIDSIAGTLLLTNHTRTAGTYNISYDYGNATIENNIRGGIISSFEALETSGDYLPIIVLAVVIAIVLFMVMGMAGTRITGGGGTAL